MHRSIKPHPQHLRYAACVIAICLVDLCFQHGPHVPRFNTNHWQAHFGENAVKPLRQRSSFQPNALEAIGIVRQHLQESFRLTRHPRFPHDLARIVHNADARFLDRHVESSKIGHAALLLLMLEAAHADLISPSPMSNIPSPHWKWLRRRPRPARSALMRRSSKSGEPRTLHLPSRRSRTAQTLSMLSATRLSPPTASKSTPWPSPGDCRRLTSSASSPKREV